MNRRLAWITWAVAPVVSSVHGVMYLSVEEAQKSLWPEADRFDLVPLSLSPGQRKAIQTRSRAGAVGTPRLWTAHRGGERVGAFWVDRVIGKHDFITYAVAIDARGTVTGVEILEYRESYGGEVRNPAWRKQFQGKTQDAPVSLGRDIQNIAGATLSSLNVTNGVRRLLFTHREVFGD